MNSKDVQDLSAAVAGATIVVACISICFVLLVLAVATVLL